MAFRGSSDELVARDVHAVAEARDIDLRGGGALGGVDGEGEAPEMVGVAGGVAGRRDGNAAGGADEAFGFAEVVAEVLVDGDLEGAVFEGLEELGG